jgi:hypothetical protein
MDPAKQLFGIPVSTVTQFARDRRYYIAAIASALVCVYLIGKLRGRSSARVQKEKTVEKVEKVETVAKVEKTGDESGTGNVIVESSTTTVTTTTTEDKQVVDPEKVKKKKDKLKKTVIDGVNLVMGESAGKFVESVIEISSHAKVGGIESFVKSGKLGKLFSQDVIPVLKSKLQKKKFPTIVGTTDSPIGELHYEVSGITLESFEVDPSVQCDVTDGSEALQIRVMLSEAKLKNISWKCGTAKIKEKGTANAEITKGQCTFRISIDKSQVLPRLSIQHCSFDLQQFNLELKGGKASWLYSFMTSVFNNKIKTKLKEKIDKVLAKKCRQFEEKINFAASRLLSIFSDKKEKGERMIEAPKFTPNKKCFLFNEDDDEPECIMIDLQSVSSVEELRTKFFDELGMQYVAYSAYVRMKFKDRTGTLITISKGTTIEQLTEHADCIHFYKDDANPNAPHTPAYPHTLAQMPSASEASLFNLTEKAEEEGTLPGNMKRKNRHLKRESRDTESSSSTSSIETVSSLNISRGNSIVDYESMYVN